MVYIMYAAEIGLGPAYDIRRPLLHDDRTGNANHAHMYKI
jgi:hypothetical protein